MKARTASKAKLDSKASIALQSLVERMAQPRAAGLPVFLSDQVRAVMAKLQEAMDAGNVACRDIKKPMPEQQEISKLANEAKKLVIFINQIMQGMDSLATGF
jgi:hypothetical protein